MTVVTRCQILRLKCTKLDFCWGSAPDPAGGAYSAPQFGLNPARLTQQEQALLCIGHVYVQSSSPPDATNGTQQWRQRRGGAGYGYQFCRNLSSVNAVYEIVVAVHLWLKLEGR